MLVMRSRRVGMRLDVRSVVVGFVLVAAVLALALVAMVSGSYEIKVGQVFSALTGGESGLTRDIIIYWRLPRVTATIVFGAALGVSGAIFQSSMRNPLASPDVIGFSSGSHTGALIVILVLNGGYLQVAAGALVGGMATALLVYLLAYRRGLQGFRLIIVGIGFSSMLVSLNSWLILRADLDQALAAAAWSNGSLNGVGWHQVVVGSIAIVVLLASAAGLSVPMRQMELGDDAAASQGVRVSWTRPALMVVGVALTATVTAASGPIAFVALVAPQIARRLARTAGITLAPAACVGALLLGIADYVAQHVAPTPLPVGVITVMVGGGYLGYLLFSEARRRI
jgi:iron complex transport system permease protein